MNSKTEVQQASQQKSTSNKAIVSDEEVNVLAYEYNMLEEAAMVASRRKSKRTDSRQQSPLLRPEKLQQLVDPASRTPAEVSHTRLHSREDPPHTSNSKSKTSNNLSNMFAPPPQQSGEAHLTDGSEPLSNYNPIAAIKPRRHTRHRAVGGSHGHTGIVSTDQTIKTA